MQQAAAPSREDCSPVRAAIAIPAHNECERLPGCLAGIAGQRPGPVQWQDIVVLVLANNCTDGTAAVARALAPVLPFRLIVRDVMLPSESAHAGGARRLAMAQAAACVVEHGVLLTTDADAVPEPSWLGSNLDCFAAGADGVAGAIRIDPWEAGQLPPMLRQQIQAEQRYGLLLDRIACLVDPEALDPWPRHPWHSGASLALTRRAWLRIGGVPDLPAGEDRALVAALRRAGLRVRHAPEVRVVVSARLDGRAAAGMAETLLHRMLRIATTADPRLEPSAQALFRLRCRASFRRSWQARCGQGWSGGPESTALPGLTTGVLETALAAPTFWAGWEQVEAGLPRLAPQALPLSALATESLAARGIIAALKTKLPGQPAATRAAHLIG